MFHALPNKIVSTSQKWSRRVGCRPNQSNRLDRPVEEGRLARPVNCVLSTLERPVPPHVQSIGRRRETIFRMFFGIL